MPMKARLVKAMVFPVVMYGWGEGNGNPLHYSCLENPVNRGACGMSSTGWHRVGHD